MSSVDPRMNEYSKAQQIIKLVQKNAGLEIELASLKDSAMLKAESARKQKVYMTFHGKEHYHYFIYLSYQEIARLEEIIRNHTAKFEIASAMARQEIGTFLSSILVILFSRTIHQNNYPPRYPRRSQKWRLLHIKWMNCSGFSRTKRKRSIACDDS